jgi:hypothetical protein
MVVSRTTAQFLTAPILLALVAVAVADSPKQWKLVYKFVPGQSVYYEVHQKMEMYTEFHETKTQQKNDVWERKHYRVISVEADGTAELETVIDQVKMKAGDGERSIDYDSSKSDSKVPVAFAGIVESIGKPQVRVRVSPSGRLITLSRISDEGKAGPEVSADAVPANDPSHNFLVSFPQEDVEIGSTWSEELTMKVVVTKDLNRDIKLLRTYELTSVKNDVATLKVVTSIKSRVNNPAILAQLIQRTPSGTVKFDIANGRITARDMKTDKRVINGLGANSVFRAVSRRSEKLVTAPVESTTN